MFVINTDKQQEFSGIIGGEFFELQEKNRLLLLNSQASLTATLVNSTTKTPDNLTKIETIGATAINKSIAIQKYNSADSQIIAAYSTGSAAPTFTGGFIRIGAVGTTTNANSTCRLAFMERLRAGMNIGRQNRIVLFSANTTAVSVVSAVTGTITATLKIMETNGTLTTIGSGTLTDSEIIPTTETISVYGPSTSGRTFQMLKPIYINTAGVTSIAGDRVILEISVSVTTITVATADFQLITTPPNSNDFLSSYVSVE